MNIEKKSENPIPLQKENELALTPRESAELKIQAIKENAKREIEEVKYALQLELLHDNKKAIDRACKKENKRRYRLAKKEEYRKRNKRYSMGEEIFNSITHGVGAGLAIAALVLLIIKAVVYAPTELKIFYIVSWILFGASLVILYLMSTLYHALTPVKAKSVFAIFDHASIYLLIAGTYTPFCLATLHGLLGWILFGIIWGLAIIGITLYSVFGKKLRVVSVITYILMGWLIIFAIKPMYQALPFISVLFLISGGIFYTAGVLFYAMKNKKWMHSVWHLFVLGGSVLHFFAVYYSI